MTFEFAAKAELLDFMKSRLGSWKEELGCGVVNKQTTRSHIYHPLQFPLDGARWPWRRTDRECAAGVADVLGHPLPWVG